MGTANEGATGTISRPEREDDLGIGQHADTWLPRRRVLYVLDSLNVGGTETQAVELARRLDPKKYDVTLACLRVRGPLLDKLTGSAVSLLEFYPKGGMDSPAGIYQLLRLAAFLRQKKFDIVHVHDLWSTLLGVPAALLARVPVVISSQRDLSHDPFYQTRRGKILRRLQRASDAVLTNASSIRDGLIEEGIFSAEKLRLVHNGLDLQRFAGVAKNIDQVLPGVSGKIVVLVGNMHTDVKGHPWLIEAAPRVVAEFPDTRFVLAGEGTSRKRFEARVAELGLEKNFFFLGRRNDVPEVLACCDMAVLPSRAEGFPNALLEYLAAGLPTIATNVGGSAEIIKDGVTGLLVSPDDAGALAAAILRFLRDPSGARQLAEAGNRYVRENFSFERLLREMDSLYSELLQNKV